MKKKTTKELNKFKLANYSSVAGAVLATGAINAQITYVDENPDVIVDSSNPFSLDFNNDANPDVNFGVSQIVDQTGTYGGISFVFNGFGAGVSAGLNAGIQGSVTGTMSTFTPAMLSNGNDISGAQNFGSGGLLGLNGIANATITFYGYPTPFTYPVSVGDWLGATDKFLGVKFTAGANTHYGWVRLDVAADASSITIKDWAYNTVADEALVADLENVSMDNKVTIKTQMDEAFVNVTPDLIGGTIAIVNMAGQEIRTIEITDINTNVKFDGLETGIYMLNARFESGSISKKFYAR